MKPKNKFIAAISSLLLSFGFLAGINFAAQKGNNSVNAIEAEHITSNEMSGEARNCYIWGSKPKNYVENDNTTGFLLSTGSKCTLETADISLSLNSNDFITIKHNNKLRNIKAFYIPFYIKKTIPANSNILQYGQVVYDIEGDGYAVKSCEVFYFDDKITTTSEPSFVPSRFYYHETSEVVQTGCQYSLGRAVTSSYTGSRNADITLRQFNYSNSEQTYYFHLGLFMVYNGSTMTDQSFKVDFRVTLYDQDKAIQSNGFLVNGYRFANFSDALTYYNSHDGATMEVIRSANISSENITLSSEGGIIDFKDKALNIGDRQIFVNASTTFTSTANTIPSNVYSLQSSKYGEIIVIDKSDIELTIEKIRLYFTYNNGDLRDAIKLTANAINSTVDWKSSTKIIASATKGSLIGLYAGKVMFCGDFGSCKFTHITAYDSGLQKEIHITGRINSPNALYIKNPEEVSIYNDFSGYPFGQTTSNLTFKYDNNKLPANGSVVIYNATDDLISHCKIDGYDYKQFLRDGDNMIVDDIKYPVTFVLGEGLEVTGEEYAVFNQQYECTFSVPSYEYRVPQNKSEFIIKVNGEAISDSNFSYTYTSSSGTGKLTIFKSAVTGDIEIIADPEERSIINFYIAGTDTICRVRGTGFTHSRYRLDNPTTNMPAYSTFIGWSEYKTGATTFYQAKEYIPVTSKQMSIYAYFTQTDEDLVDQFVGIQLHFDEDVIDTSNNEDTEACRGENGYYQIAKATYNNLSTNQKELFNTNDKYIDAKARFIAWASANNESIDSTTYQLGKMPNNGLNETILDSDSSEILIFVLTGAFAAAIAGIYLFKKKAISK